MEEGTKKEFTGTTGIEELRQIRNILVQLSSDVGITRQILEQLFLLIGDSQQIFSNSSLENKKKDEKDELEYKITQMLRELKIPPSIYGYEYLKTAICYVYKHGNVSVTKILYPYIAKEFNSSTSRVQRNLRKAIQTSWDKYDPIVFKKYIGYSNNEDDCPTVSEFVNILAEYLKYN